MAILQQPAPLQIPHSQALHGFITRWLLVDLDNPSSIMTCIHRARNNARSIRGTITSGMWRALNTLYWEISDPDFCGRVGESPGDFCRAVAAGSQLFYGVADATLTHDEGWHFLQLGKYLERADKIVHALWQITNIIFCRISPTQSICRLLELTVGGRVVSSCLAYESLPTPLH